MSRRVGVRIVLFMSEIDISTLPISKIRSALKDLGLSGSGTKKELIERYNEYMKNPKTSSSESNPEENEVTVETRITREVKAGESSIENSETSLVWIDWNRGY